MTAKDICHWTGVSPRTLDFWVRSKVINPSISQANGAGSKRQYSTADAIQCKVAVLLRSIGVETSKIVPVLEHSIDRRVQFLIVDASDGSLTAILQRPGTATFQANRTAMLLINLSAIRAEFAPLGRQ